MGGYFRGRLADETTMKRHRAGGWPVYSLAEGDYDHRSAIAGALRRYRHDIARGLVSSPQF